MELPKQFDNITSHVIDNLKVTLRQGSKVSMAAASFSIYAFEALQKELEKVGPYRDLSNEAILCNYHWRGRLIALLSFHFWRCDATAISAIGFSPVCPNNQLAFW